MRSRWVKVTVLVLVALLALSLALSVVPSDARALAVHLPPADAAADYQLGGAYRPAADVGVVVRDRTEVPSGRYDVCYLNAFQTQPGSLAWWRAAHPRLLLRSGGRLVRDPGWPDEVLLDTRTADRRQVLAAVLGGWAQGCARRGFDAIEPDNLDSASRSRRLLTQADNLAVARSLAAVAHRAGLAVAQKNTAGLTGDQVARTGFDFAVAEDCQVYAECGAYARVYGDHVIEVEYADEGPAGFRRACDLRGARWSIVYRDRDLRRPDQRGYVRAAC